MGTIDNKLKYLKETKSQIAEAIKDQGVTVEQSDTFRSYADFQTKNKNPFFTLEEIYVEYQFNAKS